jgi:hypothetical protein
MIAAGVNAKALSTFMGHANIRITLDLYGHLMPGRRRGSGDPARRLRRARARATVAPTVARTADALAQGQSAAVYHI